MNIRALSLSVALACIAFAGLAQANDTSATSKVVSLTEPPTQLCKVVTADMKYIDKAGNPEEISYRKLSDACKFQN
ncbi:DUF2790 domain-containing protein [Pseudomonas sp. FR229a]|uniref:DUF2790 domain-containing protein n=1 Tax=Pseudomonas sp. FR229a TaxID=3040313 RepID=UPI002556931E|nr:DUF2790 domain-containing protein [Pseudomonas sp. FR229a]